MKEKTEQPTPKRLRDERKKGNVPKSKEIATCAAIVGMFGYLWIFFDYIFKSIARMVTLPTGYYEVPFQEGFNECIKGLFIQFVLIAVPIAMAALIFIILSYVLQFGVIVSADPVKPDFKKIHPVEGFKRIFSLTNLLDLIKSILKVLLLFTIVYLILSDSIDLLVHIPVSTTTVILPVLGSILKKLVLAISSIFIIIAIIDYFFQKNLHHRKLRMSLDDIKREHKEREGDPQIKQQRRALHRDIVNTDVLTKIQNSTIIITQSKEIAIAIFYKKGEVKLPILELKGRGAMAEKIIDIARKANVPVVNDSSLAQKLYEKGRENNYIHSEVITPIALLLRSVMGMIRA